MKILPFLLLFIICHFTEAQVIDTVKVNREIQVHFKNKSGNTDSLYVLDRKKEVYFKGYIEDSIVCYYDPEGRLYLEGEFRNNRLNGLAYLYTDEGKLYQVANFVDGKEIGLSVSFDENMKIQNIQLQNGTYKDENSLHLLFKDGIPMSLTKGRYSDKSQYMEFYKEGNLKEVFQRNKKEDKKEFPMEFDEKGNVTNNKK